METKKIEIESGKSKEHGNFIRIKFPDGTRVYSSERGLTLSITKAVVVEQLNTLKAEERFDVTIRPAEMRIVKSVQKYFRE